MNRIIQILISIVLVLGLATGCSDQQRIPTPKNDPPPREASILEKVTGHWDIDTAYHAGSYDNSSSGKDILIRSNGTYLFDNYLEGVWYFTSDSSTMILDENKSYRQDWTITYLDTLRWIVDFKSPFTQKASQWIMSKR